MLIINFKTYAQSSGPNAVKIARSLAKAAQEFPKVESGFAPPSFDLAQIAKAASVPVWAQHTDPAGEGQFTGYLSPSNAKAAGATGTFLNHSEHPLEPEVIQKTLETVRKAGLKVLIFASSPEIVAELTSLKPNYIAYEPPELIGGSVSVTSAKPEVIKEAVASSGEIPLLIGAGVHGKVDIQTGVSLGAAGAVVSSAVITADDPPAVFIDLLAGF